MYSSRLILKILLWAGSLFFFTEFIFHMFGLPILEHDKIYLFTHDGYIALYALTYAFLLFLVSTDLKKYLILFKATMIGILGAMMNAYYISSKGGYDVLFPIIKLDEELTILGISFFMWYLLTLIFSYLHYRREKNHL